MLKGQPHHRPGYFQEPTFNLLPFCQRVALLANFRRTLPRTKLSGIPVGRALYRKPFLTASSCHTAQHGVPDLHLASRGDPYVPPARPEMRYEPLSLA